jgi:outer membrane protein assembly factor BamB
MIVLAAAVGGLCQSWPTASAPAGDWPQWRGPQRNGISAQKDWNSQFGQELKPLWSVNVGAGFSSVAVVGGRAYTMGYKDAQERIVCLQVDNKGQQVWQYPYKCGKVQYDGPRATPTVEGNRVYALGAMGDITCLDLEGKKIWAKNLKTDLGLTLPNWGFAGSPVVHGKNLILNAGKAGLALDKATGNVAWQTGKDAAGYASPVLFKQGGKDALAVFGAKALYVVDPANGQVLHSTPWATDYDVNAPDPLPVGAGGLFITSGYGRGCALVDPSGKIAWENKNMSAHFSSPVLVGDYIYGVDGNAGSKNSVVCLEAKTGQKTWSYPAGNMAGLIVDDNRLLVNTDGGLLLAGPLSPQEFKPTGSAKVGTGNIWSPPALAEGKAFLRGQNGDLVCVDLKAK